MDRNQARAKIFGAKPKVKVIEFQGVDVEIRQPAVGEIFNDTDETTSKKATIVRMIIDNCYLPGTGEKVFEDTDYENLLSMPFNEDWIKLSETMNELTNVKKATQEAAKN